MFPVGSLLTMDETAAAQHHTTRSVFLDKDHPAAWRALNGLGLKAKEAADDAGLDQTLIELLNVRISQINGCAYCLDLHVGDAVKNGESAQRLAVLPAWRDTDLFTEKERAALTLAEAITNISDARAREHEGAAARKHLTDGEFSAVSWLVIAMNAFNRVSIVSQHPVRKDRGEPPARPAAAPPSRRVDRHRRRLDHEIDLEAGSQAQVRGGSRGDVRGQLAGADPDLVPVRLQVRDRDAERVPRAAVRLAQEHGHGRRRERRHACLPGDQRRVVLARELEALRRTGSRPASRSPTPGSARPAPRRSGCAAAGAPRGWARPR